MFLYLLNYYNTCIIKGISQKYIFIMKLLKIIIVYSINKLFLLIIYYLL